MCGLLTLLSMNGHPVSEESMKRGLAALHHRGPDHRGYWMSEDRRVCLGHTRLSIIDLNTGNQPISDRTDSNHLVANGEFYDFERIRAELERRGVCFKTRSDSEIALHLYAEGGPRCLEQLRGEFAFNIWDGPNRRLFAARDRFGIKPLYYAVHDGVFYLASEVKALFAAGVPAVWDVDAFVTRAFIMDSERTLFRGVRAVPPGCALTVAGGDFHIEPYWDFAYARQNETADFGDEATAVAQTREALLEAIGLRLRADVPVGVYLSGGIDSCTALGMAAAQTSGRLEAFSISFPNTPYDEAAAAERMARHAGANLHLMAVTQDELADSFADSIWHGENVSVNVHTVAKYMLSKKTRDEGFKVVLTGEGSDEIFGGYAHFRSDMLQYNAEGQDPSDIEALRRQLNETNRGFYRLYAADDADCAPEIKARLGFEPTWFKLQRRYIGQFQRVYNQNCLAGFREKDVFVRMMENRELCRGARGLEPVHAAMYLWSKSILPTYQLSMLGDRMEMANSIEGRAPFLDHCLVERVARLPVRLKIRGMTEKWLLREAARPYITPEVCDREKRPFVGPPTAAAPGDRLHQLMHDILHGPTLGELPFFDRNKTLAMLEETPGLPPEAQAANDATLLEIVSLCILQERFGLTA